MTDELRELDQQIEWSMTDAINAITARRADHFYRQARRLERKRDELLGLCDHCHGDGKVWDSSGWCALHQMPRRCDLCDGTGKAAAMRER